MKWTRLVAALPALGTAGVAAYDLTQKNHSLLRNFPVLGHARYAIELIGPGRAGLFVNLVPVFAPLLAVLILGEPFGLYHAVALVLVLGGIFIAERLGR